MRTGERLRSQVCEGEVIVVRAEGAQQPIDAGGLAMVPPEDPRAGSSPLPPDLSAGFGLGKRYELRDEAEGLRIEVMVTRKGTGTLAYAGRPLELRATKPLPSSD